MSEKPTTESSSSKIRASKNVTVAFKLNGGNYPLWSLLMKVAIGSRGDYSHITGKPAPPLPGSKEYDDWEETDLIVFSWIVDNIENDIIADFAHHQSAKAIWDSLATTYESEADLYLVYDLEDKANTIKQGNMDLETYYRKIHGMWINIDRCQKQPVDCCEKGVNQFRVYTNTKRLLRLLAGLNEEHEGVRRDILEEVSPLLETAYGWVKKEVARRRLGPPESSNTITNSHGGGDSQGIGHGLAAQDSDKVTGVEPRVKPPPLTARGANRWTNRTFGAPTAECKSTHEKRASNCLGIPNSGRKGRRQEQKWQSEFPPEMRRRKWCREIGTW